jgi:hypothetical protein
VLREHDEIVTMDDLVDDAVRKIGGTASCDGREHV